MFKIATLFSSLVACASATIAIAQESRLSILAKPPSFNPSGFVIGVDGGLGTLREAQNSRSAAIARVEFGYDFAWRQLLVGASGEYLISGFPKVTSDPGTLKFNSTSALKLKLGWFFDDWLLFGTLGWAHASLSFTDRVTTTRTSSDGMLYSVGLEYFIVKDISVNVQASRYDLGSASVPSINGWKTMHPSLQTATAGVRYRF